MILKYLKSCVILHTLIYIKTSCSHVVRGTGTHKTKSIKIFLRQAAGYANNHFRTRRIVLWRSVGRRCLECDIATNPRKPGRESDAQVEFKGQDISMQKVR